MKAESTSARRAGEAVRYASGPHGLGHATPSMSCGERGREAGLNLLILGCEELSLPGWSSRLVDTAGISNVFVVPDSRSAAAVLDGPFEISAVIGVARASGEETFGGLDVVDLQSRSRLPRLLVSVGDESTSGDVGRDSDVRRAPAHDALIFRVSHPDDVFALLDLAVRARIWSSTNSEANAPARNLADGPDDAVECGESMLRKAKLTPRQSEVMHLVNQGKSNKEIARDLELTEGTVKVHCKAIFRALGVSNRTQAAVLIAKAGLSADVVDVALVDQGS